MAEGAYGDCHAIPVGLCTCLALEGGYGTQWPWLSPDMNTTLPISVFSFVISLHGSMNTVQRNTLDNFPLLEQLHYSGVMYLR
jgi:hypothetical protein